MATRPQPVTQLQEAVRTLEPHYTPRNFDGVSTEELIYALGDMESKRDAYQAQGKQAQWKALTVITSAVVHELEQRGMQSLLERIYRHGWKSN